MTRRFIHTNKPRKLDKTKTYYIYGLYTKYDDKLFYIGMSGNLFYRYLDHSEKYGIFNTRVLCEGTYDEIFKKEKTLIRIYRLEYELTNIMYNKP